MRIVPPSLDRSPWQQPNHVITVPHIHFPLPVRAPNRAGGSPLPPRTRATVRWGCAGPPKAGRHFFVQFAKAKTKEKILNVIYASRPFRRKKNTQRNYRAIPLRPIFYLLLRREQKSAKPRFRTQNLRASFVCTVRPFLPPDVLLIFTRICRALNVLCSSAIIPDPLRALIRLIYLALVFEIENSPRRW